MVKEIKAVHCMWYVSLIIVVTETHDNIAQTYSILNYIINAIRRLLMVMKGDHSF